MQISFFAELSTPKTLPCNLTSLNTLYAYTQQYTHLIHNFFTALHMQWLYQCLSCNVPTYMYTNSSKWYLPSFVCPTSFIELFLFSNNLGRLPKLYSMLLKITLTELTYICLQMLNDMHTWDWIWYVHNLASCKFTKLMSVECNFKVTCLLHIVDVVCWGLIIWFALLSSFHRKLKKASNLL